MPEIRNQSRLRVLFLPAWYPSETNPVEGIFVKEHARAASLFNDIVVLYAYGDPSPEPKGLYRVSEDVEDGIRTIRVRYGGILFRTKRWLAGRLARAIKTPSTGAQQSTAGRAKRAWGKPFEIFSAAIGYSLYYWSLFAVFRKLVRGGRKPDIIHAHVFFAGVPAVLLGKLYRTPVVITEHYSGFPRHALTLSQRLQARFALNKANMVLPVSSYLKQSIQAYRISNDFRIVPNAVDTDRFCPLPSLHKRDRNEKKKLLLVALLGPPKGIPYLLEALNLIKRKRLDFFLDIVGDGPNRGEYEELVGKLGLGGLVAFHGLKPKEEVAKFMQDCDFYVQPSLWETFGVVYAEAMACGKPVIASEITGLLEIVNEDVGILVPPKDVEALAQAIENMLDNYANYSPSKIAQYARERFGYEAVGRMLDGVYRELKAK